MKSGDVALVRQLAEADEGQIESTTVEGQTALQLAAIYGHKEIAEVLLEHGADVETLDLDPGDWDVPAESGVRL